MSVLRRERPLNRKIALLAKMTAAHYFARSQSPPPSDNALMRSGPHLRKFCIIKIADLLITKFSADAAAVYRYDRGELSLNLLRSRCVLR